jgi:hypothetical protein
MTMVPVMEPMSVPVEPVSLMKPMPGVGPMSEKLVDVTAVPGVDAPVMRVVTMRVPGLPPLSAPRVAPGLAGVGQPEDQRGCCQRNSYAPHGSAPSFWQASRCGAAPEQGR